MGYTTLDIAVLLEKGIVLNGIIANSPSVDERRKAKAEFKELLPQLIELADLSPDSQNVNQLKLENNIEIDEAK